MIESGSLTPGVGARDFGLADDTTALRYELPALALRHHLLSYTVLDSDRLPGQADIDWMLPGWAQIWIILSPEPIAVRLGNRTYDPMPAAALYGVTSYAMMVRPQGGVTVGIYVSPLGWARLFSISAESLRDQVAPLDKVMPPDLVAELVGRLRALADAKEVKATLDDFFGKHMAVPHRDEPLIRTVLALIADEGTGEIGIAAAARGIDMRKMREVSKRYFGFPPKTLQMRSRFLRSLVRMMGRHDGVAYSEMEPSYHGASHFARDARRFLRMSPKSFLALHMPYLRAALRARWIVLTADRTARRNAAPPDGKR